MSKTARWIAIIVIVTLIATWLVWRVSASRSWPTVEGKINHSEVITQKIPRLAFSNGETFSDQFEVALAYEYTVSGARHLGHNLFTARPNVFGREDTALKMIAQFPAGKTVRVFYDLSEPSRACLIPGLTLPVSGYLALLVGLALFLVAIGLITRFVSRRRVPSNDGSS